MFGSQTVIMFGSFSWDCVRVFTRRDFIFAYLSTFVRLYFSGIYVRVVRWMCDNICSIVYISVPLTGGKEGGVGLTDEGGKLT